VGKGFKRVGNKIVVVGRVDPQTLGGSVYADSYGQRGDRLFDAYDADSIRSLWDALRDLHGGGGYVSGSAIAEGGMLLRLFEGSWGSGLGAQVDFPNSLPGRRDGILFGEFVGSVLLEIPAKCDLATFLNGIPHCVIGEVIPQPRLVLAEGAKVVWQESTSNLAERWSKTFHEVVE
jgi:phosphoribosylformylglycinamidine (FGAM) synthase-like enzyme